VIDWCSVHLYINPASRNFPACCTNPSSWRRLISHLWYDRKVECVPIVWLLPGTSESKPCKSRTGQDCWPRDGRDSDRQASDSLHFRTLRISGAIIASDCLSCKQAQNGGHKPRPYWNYCPRHRKCGSWFSCNSLSSISVKSAVR
jgi:hypothetical protein